MAPPEKVKLDYTGAMACLHKTQAITDHDSGEFQTIIQNLSQNTFPQPYQLIAHAYSSKIAELKKFVEGVIARVQKIKDQDNQLPHDK